MFGYVASFILGMIVMDFMWAYKLGLVQSLYRRIKGN